MENITLPMDLAGRKPDQGWLDSIVGTVGLGDRLTHRPSELSGCQQQRDAVSRAPAARPKIIEQQSAAFVKSVSVSVDHVCYRDIKKKTITIDNAYINLKLADIKTTPQ